MLAGHQAGQVAIPLGIVAVQADLIHAQVRVRAVAQAHRAGRARDFLHHDDVREIAEVRAAPALGHRDAEQALRAELRPQRAGKFVRAIDLVRERRDLAGGEAPHLAADLIERLAESEIEFPGSRRCVMACQPSQSGSYDCRTIGREAQGPERAVVGIQHGQRVRVAMQGC